MRGVLLAGRRCRCLTLGYRGVLVILPRLPLFALAVLREPLIELPEPLSSRILGGLFILLRLGDLHLPSPDVGLPLHPLSAKGRRKERGARLACRVGFLDQLLAGVVRADGTTGILVVR